MRQRLPMFYALIMCSLASGCAPRLPQVAVSFQPLTTFDGQYNGWISIKDFAEGGERSACDTPEQITLDVRNGAFTYAQPHPNLPGNPTPVYTTYINPDGSFRGQAGVTGVMAGNVAGTRLAGLIEGSGCDYTFTATRL